MSRIGRLPVTVPHGVQVEIDGLNVKVKGPKGTLERTFAPGRDREHGTRPVLWSPATRMKPTIRALHGTTRALINNMVTGVTPVSPRCLEIDGVGYRADHGWEEPGFEPGILASGDASNRRLASPLRWTRKPARSR